MAKDGKREKLLRIYNYIVDTDADNNYDDLLEFINAEIELVNKKNKCHKKVTVVGEREPC